MQSLEKIGKSCILKLDPEQVEFIVRADLTDHFEVWASVEVVFDFSMLYDSFGRIILFRRLVSLMPFRLKVSTTIGLHSRCVLINGNMSVRQSAHFCNRFQPWTT